MSGMFWIALELSIPKIGFSIMLSLTVKKVDVFILEGVAESDNTGGVSSIKILRYLTLRSTRVAKRMHHKSGSTWVSRESRT